MRREIIVDYSWHLSPNSNVLASSHPSFFPHDPATAASCPWCCSGWVTWEEWRMKGHARTHTHSQKEALAEHCCVSDIERVAVRFGGKCHHVMCIVSMCFCPFWFHNLLQWVQYRKGAFGESPEAAQAAGGLWPVGYGEHACMHMCTWWHLSSGSAAAVQVITPLRTITYILMCMLTMLLYHWIGWVWRSAVWTVWDMFSFTVFVP